MKPILILSGLMVAALAGSGRVEGVDEPFRRFIAAAEKTSWPEELAARQELKKTGPAALPLLLDAARTHKSGRVRSSCYEVLLNDFADEQQVGELLIAPGLKDPEPAIRYRCAFSLGDRKRSAAVPALRTLLGDYSQANTSIRFAAAKSLAQLGEADVLRILYEAVASDGYMARSMGNAGLKALSDKNLDDFEGYHYGEGAAVSGGLEYASAFDAVQDAERKAKRYGALLAYVRWLQAERPELYKHLTGAF